MAGERSITGDAAEIGVSAATLRRWVRDGLVATADDGALTDRGLEQARTVRRLRERGYSLAEIRSANASGVLASSHIEALPDDGRRWSVARAARELGLSRSLAVRLLTAFGLGDARSLTALELELLRAAADVLEAGLPLTVVLQLARIYGQAMSHVADAEVRLVHHHVHEPLMASGIAPEAVAEELQSVVAAVLPVSSRLIDALHRHYVRHSIEQDVVGHMEKVRDPQLAADTNSGHDEEEEVTRLRVAIVFADLAGYTRLTEELGDARAVETVERFVAEIERTLPADARVVKTIGDGVMIVGADTGALARWAAAFQGGRDDQEPRSRIGMHAGHALFFEGDYYGREVNLAARVAARAAAGEVVVTRPVVAAAGRELRFERLGEIRLKGFAEPTEILLAHAEPDG